MSSSRTNDLAGLILASLCAIPIKDNAEKVACMALPVEELEEEKSKQKPRSLVDRRRGFIFRSFFPSFFSLESLDRQREVQTYRYYGKNVSKLEQK